MTVIVPMPGNEAFAEQLASLVGAGTARVEHRRFPDGESYVRLHGSFAQSHTVVVCTLRDPDPQLASLLFTARTARDLGASRVTLVAPYLAYMRQDKAFHAGEAVSSQYFADVIASAFDGLITVDPHLHRYRALGEVYRIPALTLHAAPLIGRWISTHVQRPLVIGPDEEARQWAELIANTCAAPFAVLNKTRLGDRDVRLALPDLASWRGHTAVLVDDIISSGRTLAEAARLLDTSGFGSPWCVAVHAIFADDALNDLQSIVAGIVSTDSIPHRTNGIALAPLVAEGIRSL